MSHSASQSTTEPAVAVAAQPPSAAASSIATATELKAAGNELFAKGENDKAIAKWTKVFAYTAGLSLASGSAAAGIMAVTKAGSSHVPALADGQQAALDALNLTTNTNLAMAYLRVGRPDKAVYFASKALTQQADSTKALFRRGCAYRLLGRLDDSRADLDRAAQLAPSDAAIKAELAKLRDSERAAALKERQHYAGMFDKASRAE